MIAPWAWPVLAWIVAILGFATWLMPAGWPQCAMGTVALAILAFCLWFFRNPRRTAPEGPRRLVAPADGVIDVVAVVDEPDYIGGKAQQVGIFLSVFDVHVNRSPVAGTVRYARWRPGAFHDARRADCADVNEANIIGIEVDPAVAPGLRLAVRQVAGLIARRIVCAAGVGDRIERGGLYGMIRFGSRTELLVPVGWNHRVLVKPGDRVVGGETVIIELAPTAEGQP